MTVVRPLTSSAPGAIAILQLEGELDRILGAMSSHEHWPTGSARLASPGGIDDCMVVRIDETTAQIMPHGGPRVQQRLLAWLGERGIGPADERDADWPEAGDVIESAMLSVLATAASPLAVDLLLAQPAYWRAGGAWTPEDDARSRRLDHLLTPPRVVVVGEPNVGKSTLLNTLAGRDRVITSDTPGTTRDFVTAEVECAGLVVHWFDTPGIRTTDDPVEEQAVELARRLVTEAHLLIAAADAEHDWPDLPRAPDLRIATKADRSPRTDADVVVSATTGHGIPTLVHTIRDTLVPPQDLAAHRPWRFHPDLPTRA